MKRSLFTMALGALMCLALAETAGASGLCCQLSSGVQENIAGVAAPGTEQISLQLSYSLTKMDEYKEGSSTRSLSEARAYRKPDGTSYTILPLEMDMIKYTLTAAYGFSPEFKAFVSLPYVRNTMNMTSSNGAMLGWTRMTMPSVSGVSDATLMGLYRLYKNRAIRPTDAVTLGIGLKAPTGSSTERNANGSLIHAHMQPGTGSWDPLASIIYTRMLDSLLVQTDATYQLTTRNREGYKFGNSLAVNATGKYAVLREFNITAGLTYLHLGRASDRNGRYYDHAANSSLIDDPANTGGDSLWVSGGIQVLPVRNSVIDLKMQVPAWESVNGIQLVTSTLFLAGVSYSF